MNRLYIISILWLTMIGCQDRLGIEAYISFLSDPENGLTKRAEISNTEYIMQYRPIDLAVYRELKSGSTDEGNIRSELDGLNYFLLQVNRTGHIDQKDISSSSFYYAYQFEKDLYQLFGNDTIRPSLYLLEQGLGGKDQFNINIAFPGNNKDLTIHCEDKFGGSLQFDFLAASLSRIPKLKM